MLTSRASQRLAITSRQLLPAHRLVAQQATTTPRRPRATAVMGSSSSSPVSTSAAASAAAGAGATQQAEPSNGGVDVPAGRELAVVGGGCFWCVEGCFTLLRGVDSAVSGYAGGHVQNPTYEQVCGKKTGHAEVVGVVYDPSVVTYKDLLRMFFTVHDPTTKDRQGNDVGPQYRSAIYYTSDAQKQQAEEVMGEIEAEKLWGSAPLTTELAPLTKFWPAEAYHQDYYRLNPNQGYCRAVVSPKVAKFRKAFADRLAK